MYQIIYVSHNHTKSMFPVLSFAFSLKAPVALWVLSSTLGHQSCLMRISSHRNLASQNEQPTPRWKEAISKVKPASQLQKIKGPFSFSGKIQVIITQRTVLKCHDFLFKTDIKFNMLRVSTPNVWETIIRFAATPGRLHHADVFVG